MPQLNNFELFSGHLKTIADNWEPMSAEFANPASGYRVMANTAINLLKDASPTVPERLTSTGVYHGARVIARYCHLAALVSNREGYTKDGLVHMLEHPTSFGQLAMIAKQPNSIAADLEAHYGLSYTHSEDPRSLKPYLTEYSGSPDYGMLIPELLPDIINARDWLSTADQERMCPAHKVGQLSKIYGEFVKICAKDPILFDATLRDGGDLPANPAKNAGTDRTPTVEQLAEAM